MYGISLPEKSASSSSQGFEKQKSMGAPLGGMCRKEEKGGKRNKKRGKKEGQKREENWRERKKRRDS